MAIPDAQMLVFEIALKGYIAAGGGSVKNIANVFHYRRLSVVNPVVKADVVAGFVTDILPTIVAALNDRAFLTQATVRCVNDAMDAEFSQALTDVGAITGDGLSNFNCVTIRLKSAVRSRSAMGSKHFGPLSESDGADDVLSSTGLTRWQAVRDKLDDQFTDASGNTFQPCILSRKQSQLVSNPTTVTSYDVESCILNTTYGTMKRRKVRTVS